MQRKARQSRLQTICVVADNSGSMAGPKAQAATDGIREILLRCVFAARGGASDPPSSRHAWDRGLAAMATLNGHAAETVQNILEDCAARLAERGEHRSVPGTLTAQAPV